MWSRIRRLVHHRWHEDAGRRIDKAVLHRLGKQVGASEKLHSGEIRVCLEASLPNSYLLRPVPIAQLVRQRALSQFGRFRVWDTEHNNGVLIYVLLAEHSIELVADRGVNRFVSSAQWENIVKALGTALAAGDVEKGLSQAIEEVSRILQEHFPLKAGEENPNELPDQPVWASF
jgi:uncharacterized membrane protein